MTLENVSACTIFVLLMLKLRQRRDHRIALDNRSFVRFETRLIYLDSIIGSSDTECVNELRMDRRTFGLLCELLRTDGRLKNDGLVSVEEQVCMFYTYLLIMLRIVPLEVDSSDQERQLVGISTVYCKVCYDYKPIY